MPKLPTRLAYSYCYFNSPIGQLALVAEDKSLVAVCLLSEELEFLKTSWGGNWNPNMNGVLDQTVKQLSEYFAGMRTSFDLPLKFIGTAFQKRVWETLLTIPYGATKSYGDQAKLIGQPKAARAVGSANGKNLLAIIVPCHRIIGSNGGLGGYGGGLDRKRWLLALEEKSAKRLLMEKS